MARRRIDYIERESKGMLKHVRDNSSQKFAADLEARIRIDFDEPNIKVLVNHEVKPEYLEIML